MAPTMAESASRTFRLNIKPETSGVSSALTDRRPSKEASVAEISASCTAIPCTVMPGSELTCLMKMVRMSRA